MRYYCIICRFHSFKNINFVKSNYMSGMSYDSKITASVIDVFELRKDRCAFDLSVSMSNMNLSDENMNNKCETREDNLVATLPSNKTEPEMMEYSDGGFRYVGDFSLILPFLRCLPVKDENKESSDNAHVSPINIENPWQSCWKRPPVKFIRSDKKEKSILSELNASIVAQSSRCKFEKYGRNLHCVACGKFMKTRLEYEEHWNNHRRGGGLVRQVHICKYCEKVCAGIYRYREHRLLGCFADNENKSSIIDLSSTSSIIDLSSTSSIMDLSSKSSRKTASSSVVRDSSASSICPCHPFISCNGSHTCGICSQVLDNLKSLHKHYRLHEKQYACTICGKTGIKYDMRFHAKKEHFRKNGRYLSQNLRFLNQNKRNMKSFAKSKIKARDKTEKSKTRSYYCNKCHATFKEKKALLRHQFMKRHAHAGTS